MDKPPIIPPKQKWWQFSVQDSLIATGGVCGTLAFLRIPNLDPGAFVLCMWLLGTTVGYLLAHGAWGKRLGFGLGFGMFATVGVAPLAAGGGDGAPRGIGQAFLVLMLLVFAVSFLVESRR